MREIAVAVKNANERVSVVETINSIKNVGFKNVFVEWYDENLEFSQEEQVKLCKELGLNIIFAHLGYQNISAIWQEGTDGDNLVERFKNNIKYCSQNGISMVIMHLIGRNKDIKYGEIGLNRIRKITEYAKELGVKVAFENTRIKGYLEYVLKNIKDDNVGICFDAGHCHAFFNDELDFEYFKDRIFAVHLHDNDKSDDLHLLPFDGTIDWEKVIQNLKIANYDGPVTLELLYRYDYLNQSLDDFYKEGYKRALRLREMFEN